MQKIFDAALEIEESRRYAFIAETCGDDLDLRAEVEGLIASLRRASTQEILPPLLSDGVSPPVDSPDTSTSLVGLRIHNYQVDEAIGSGGMAQVYVAHHLVLPRKAALKVLHEHFSHNAEIVQRFVNEARAANAIAHPNIIEVIDAGRLDVSGAPYILMEYLDGESLGARMRAGRLPSGEVVRVAIETAEAIAAAHDKGIIHRDLKPENIFLVRRAEALASVKVLDFGIAKLRNDVASALSQTQVGMVIGTPQYMSPEHCRDASTVDHRTDIYSLGVILYQMACGRLPFESAGGFADIVYLHVAVDPDPPRKFAPNLPIALESIILRCLAKSPSDRYATMRELVEALRAVVTGDQDVLAPVSTLGDGDARDRFQVPQRLYGRERETEFILTAFERSSVGEKRLVLVSGPSGIGKSALVQSVQRPITTTGGYFVSGKCEGLNRNIPYSAFAQAFRDLVRQLLTEGPDNLARWRQSIHEAVGTDGQVILDIVPELESIIGSQPAVRDLDPEEAQIRFNGAFRRFVRVFCRVGQPFVLFFDDAQWMDAAGLHLMRSILLDTQVSHLLLVWCYRDDEVDGAHPMMKLVDEASEVGTRIEAIRVSRLGKADVHQLISDGMHGRHQDLSALARIICERCDGNPFFVNQYLDHLHREGVIQFVAGLGSWTWDAARLDQVNVTDGIAELMRAKILKAPQAARQTLQIAACIGSRFDLSTLSIVSGKPRRILATELHEALREGFITFVGASDRLLDESLPDTEVVFRFVHDRVHQAMHDMLGDDVRKRVHLQIARLLIQRSADVEGGDHLFEVVDHLNQAWDLITDDEERSAGVALNLRAGMRAKANVAYDVAARSLRQAMANLPPQAWDQQYELTSQLFLECAECEYLSGSFEVAEELLDEALTHLRTNVERASAFDLKIPMRTNRGRPAEAIHLGVEALALFGIELVAKPAPSVVSDAIGETRRRLEGISVDNLLHLPTMVDREKLAIMRVLNRLGPPAYFTDQGLYALMHCLVIELTLEYGQVSESVRGYSVYGMILGETFASFEEGTRYGQLAIELSDKLANVQMKGVSRVLYGCFIGHWTHGADESLIHLKDGHQFLRESGNVVLASFALCFHAATLWIKGEPLEHVREDAARSLGYLRQAKYRDMITFMECIDRAALTLMGNTRSPISLGGDDLDEESAVVSMRGGGIKTPLHFYTLAKMQLLYVSGDLIGAQEMAARSEEMLPHSHGSLLVAEHHFFAALIAFGRNVPSIEDESASSSRGSDESRRLLSLWAGHCPGNFAAKHLLVEAECARVSGRQWAALDFYEQAVTAAREARNLFVEALSNELAGRYHLQAKRTFIASAYLRQACQIYTRWGACEKAAQLEQEYLTVLGPASR